jgi:hypothetical protein
MIGIGFLFKLTKYWYWYRLEKSVKDYRFIPNHNKPRITWTLYVVNEPTRS